MADPYNSGPRSPPALRLDDSMVTTAMELPGFRVVRSLGVVRVIISLESAKADAILPELDKAL